ncbi:NADPH-dependent FMN reductase [Nocardiopsis nanhaiensis]
MPGTEKPLRVVVIIGSICRGRFAPVAAEWFTALARQREDLEVDVIDLAQACLPEVLTDDGDHLPPAVCELGPWLDRADAFTVVTPEYNHSFPGALKTAIDWFSHEWRAKPIAFVSYGGDSGGRRAVEQLRPVFAALEAVTIRDTVSLIDHREHFGGEGHPIDPQVHEPAARTMLDRLTWWARALSLRRARDPYDS